jgi:tRNA(Ser,Leu) C12 N-acetylase TAN1
VKTQENELMVEVMFLLSDVFLASKCQEFRAEMNVDIDENMDKIKRLVEKWEHL